MLIADFGTWAWIFGFYSPASLHLVILPDTTMLRHLYIAFSVSSPLTWMFSYWHRANESLVAGHPAYRCRLDHHGQAGNQL